MLSETYTINLHSMFNFVINLAQNVCGITLIF